MMVSYSFPVQKMQKKGKTLQKNKNIIKQKKP
jgi:hypothetical protein